MYVCIYPTHQPQAGCDLVNFEVAKNWFQFNFYFLLDSLPNQGCNHSCWGGGENIDSCPFPRALAWSEMHIASSMIWTQATDSISSDDHHYFKTLSFYIYIYIYIYLYIFFSYLSVTIPIGKKKLLVLL